jgi:hypothetical protein
MVSSSGRATGLHEWFGMAENTTDAFGLSCKVTLRSNN